ncbi:unnamed protein product [Linum tenue]|uniref:CCHC-type domain-containing protein n=1 Tax=Linum tenue TaxID=586396 RepID=A0AAV0LG14_9ROSI|nr:unnamed protein product [Linum tenue]
MQYARVCVEVDLTKPVLDSYRNEGKKYYIEYESLHNICMECGKYGHAKASCPRSFDLLHQQLRRSHLALSIYRLCLPLHLNRSLESG